MSLRDVRSQGLGRITAIIAAMMIALATMFAFTSMPQQALAADDSQTNFDSWTEVAANIEKQLETAEQDYNDGNYYQAGTDFQNAHWVGYDASNFSKVVNDTIGADKQKALLQEFTDLESLAYQQDQGDAITAKVDALTAWASDVKEYALQQAVSGKEWTGWKLVEGRSNRKYTNDAVVAATVEGAGFDPYERKVLGITAMQKLLGKSRFEELLAPYIEKPQGKPTLVPESDKRPAINTAKNDFMEEF